MLAAFQHLGQLDADMAPGVDVGVQMPVGHFADLLPQQVIVPQVIAVAETKRREDPAAVIPNNAVSSLAGIIHDLHDGNSRNGIGIDLIHPQFRHFTGDLFLWAIDAPDIVPAMRGIIDLRVELGPAPFVEPSRQRVAPGVADGSAFCLNIAGTTDK